jgi:hypothetical protein
MGIFFPPRAATSSGQIDALYMFLVVVSGVMTILIFLCVLFFAFKYRRKPGDGQPKPIHGSIPLELIWSVIPLMIMLVLFAWGTKLYFQYYAAAQGNARYLRDRKAVDVEGPVSRRPARDRRAARAHGPAGQTDPGERGRDPQLLYPRVSIEARRGPRELSDLLVRGHDAGALSHLLRRILRHESFEDDRLGDGDGPGRLSGTGWPARRSAARWRSKAKSCSSSTAA